MSTKKPLPTVSAPTMSVTLPLSGVKVRFRPFVIKEQKALLLAQESKDGAVVLETIKSVIDTCTFGTLDFAKIPTTDLAYFFLQLRIASVGPTVKFGIECEKCGHDNTITMSLEDVKVDVSKVVTEVKITDSVGIKFRLPTVDDAIDADGTEVQSGRMLFNLIDCVYDEDSVYQKSDYTEEEFTDWIEGMNEQQAQRIEEFVTNIPELSHTVTFSCVECNHEQSRRLEGLHNFFRFGDDT